MRRPVYRQGIRIGFDGQPARISKPGTVPSAYGMPTADQSLKVGAALETTVPTLSNGSYR
jgi:hypothetical protein